MRDLGHFDDGPSALTVGAVADLRSIRFDCKDSRPRDEEES